MGVFHKMRQHLRTPKVLLIGKFESVDVKITVYTEDGFFPKRAYIIKKDSTGLKGSPADEMKCKDILALAKQQ